jgi:hypothetical protein
MLAFLHISASMHAPFAEELRDIGYAEPRETAVVIERTVMLRLGSRSEKVGDDRQP